MFIAKRVFYVVFSKALKPNTSSILNFLRSKEDALKIKGGNLLTLNNHFSLLAVARGSLI